MLSWHYRISGSLNIVCLLESDYQRFRNLVCRRTGRDLDYRAAIKEATIAELEILDEIRHFNPMR
jgi:hypothetical protein